MKFESSTLAKLVKKKIKSSKIYYFTEANML